MVRRKKLKPEQNTCLRQAGKLLQQTGMLWPGARIGLALSGGIDSWVMLQVMLLRQRIIPFPFELLILHLNPGFDPQAHVHLKPWLIKQGLAAHLEVTDFGPRAHSSENNQSSPCFFCAWQRRKRLFDLCQHYKLTHLALGHNSDDLVSTFFMNMLHSGKIQGLVPKESYFRGQLTLIRPLLLIDKATLSLAAQQWHLPIWENPCPSKDLTARSQSLEAALKLCAGDKHKQTNMLNALRRWQLQTWQKQQY